LRDPYALTDIEEIELLWGSRLREIYMLAYEIEEKWDYSRLVGACIYAKQVVLFSSIHSFARNPPSTCPSKSLCCCAFGKISIENSNQLANHQ
jgi:hypothetical protein